MDRAEYKERIARIDDLLSRKSYDEALDLMDSINWGRLHNVNSLVEGAERYEILSKPYDAKELLEIAHERSPIGRMIIYRLAILCANLGEIEEAIAYHQKFIELAPNDNLRFIIKYEINKAKGADKYVLISALEELKATELIEEWAFELACLYQETGQIDKCISVLDEIILWFGEGPYVEQAYEIKMHYRPLTKEQEIQYQSMNLKDSPVTEIHPGEHAARNELLGHTVRIPRIEENPGQFDTQNLQAEIRKNIEEIMKASEVEEVSGNIEAIQSLIEDIPHIQMEEEFSNEEKKSHTQKLDAQLKSKFEEYLSEEFDGQISLIETGREKIDDQIEGQVTIEDITNRWEKTKRAAEQALLERKQQELLRFKEEAIAKASDVLDRIIESETANQKPKEEKNTFHIPKIEPEGKVTGDTFEIPIITLRETKELPTITPEDIEEIARQAREETLLDAQASPNYVPTKEIKEFPRIQISLPQDTAIESEEVPDIGTFVEEVPIADNWDMLELSDEDHLPLLDPNFLTTIWEEEAKRWITSDISAEQALKDINEMLQQEIDKLSGEAEEEIVEDTEGSLNESIGGNTTTDLPLIDISDIGSEIPTHLSDMEKEELSIFAGIPGMEASLCKALSGAKETIGGNAPKLKGHIIIQGREGCGKTKLAQSIIKILQMETGHPNGNVGKISASKLNEKDVRLIIEKIQGGALIVEKAGELSKETIVSLNVGIEGDNSGTLFIMEDSRDGIDNLLKQDPRLAKKFTEKISIPIMTIDELVNFARIYAAEEGYVIDEMGVLALYDRVNLSGLPNQPASIAVVKDIVDDAINSAKSRKFKGLFGLFSNKAEDDSKNPILQERDFMDS